MSRKIAGARALLVALLALLALAGTAQAANFKVTKTTDTADGTCDADCSLREAVIASNETAGTDTITLPGGHYTLTRDGTFEDASATGDVDFTASAELIGAGARTTIIDGTGIDRDIEIAPFSEVAARQALGQPAVDVSISGVTITGGQAPAGTMGGGISVTSGSGSLDLTDSTVTGNNVPSSKSLATGGGIYSAGSLLTVTRSTISKNITDQGGGVAISGSTARFTNDTITQNKARTFGNGGGGVLVLGTSFVRFLNTTISDNSIDSGFTTQGSSNKGGGIATSVQSDDANVSATNTIISGNAPFDCREAIGTGGHNIDGGNLCGFTGAGDQQNTNAKLGALANNGGPTDTMALLSGSPAIDRADNSPCPATDQRGVTRPQPNGGTCDVGAFEVKAGTDLSITETDSPDPVLLGGTLTYKLTGKNNGAGDDPNSTITDQLPAGLQFLSASSSQGTCSHAGQKVTCQVGTLSGTGSAAFAARSIHASATSTVTVTIRVRPKKLGTFTNPVTISGSQSESTLVNNKDKVRTRVIERNRPRLSLSGIPNGCVTGSFSFTVRISDQSSTRASVALDGHTALRTSRKRFTVRVHASELSSKTHTLTVTAVDHYGNRGRRTASFRRCRRAVLPNFTG